MNAKPGRRHRRKTIDEIVEQKEAIAAGAAPPPDWAPDPNGRMYEARLRAWRRPCPKCGALALQSCRSAREGSVRWAFHQARWGRKTDE